MNTDFINMRFWNFQLTLHADTPLGEAGLGIDSIDFLELVLELERCTGITIRNEQLTAESLATTDNIRKSLLEKIG